MVVKTFFLGCFFVNSVEFLLKFRHTVIKEITVKTLEIRQKIGGVEYRMCPRVQLGSSRMCRSFDTNVLHKIGKL